MVLVALVTKKLIVGPVGDGAGGGGVLFVHAVKISARPNASLDFMSDILRITVRDRSRS